MLEVKRLGKLIFFGVKISNVIGILDDVNDQLFYRIFFDRTLIPANYPNYFIPVQLA